MGEDSSWEESSNSSPSLDEDFSMVSDFNQVWSSFLCFSETFDLSALFVVEGSNELFSFVSIMIIMRETDYLNIIY